MSMQVSVDRNVKKTIFITAVVAALLCVAQGAFSQQKRVIQLSGVVLGQDSVSGLPGVHVYVPKAGRGTTTNGVGFFSMPVLVGDSIVISSVGYEKQYYIVPPNAPEYQTVIVPMVEDVIYLKGVTIVDFPTEEVFKEAVLALNMPTDETIDRKNMSQELLALMVKTTPMDGAMNSRLYLNQWAGSANGKFQPVSNPLLNPFNWVKFFNSLKKDKKKK